MKIGFALITANPFFSDIVAIENKYHDRIGFHNKLETINNIPHTTLFQGDFSENIDYKEVANQIAQKARMSQDTKQLNFQKVEYIPHGWYFYTCSIPDVLQELHNFTLSLIKDYIILSPNRLDRDLSALSKEQIAAIDKYGYRYAGNAFFPHITLGRTSSDKEQKTLDLLTEELAGLSTIVPLERVTVYKMGADGMHAETLYEIAI